MGSVNIDNTGSGGSITLSSDGTDLLLDGTAVGGLPELYAENPSSPTAPSATGTNAVAIGENARATGDRGMAFGSESLASGVNSIALGRAATSSGLLSNAMGFGATAGAQSSFAMGYSATTATGLYSTAIGRSYASGTDSLAAAIASNSSIYGATGTSSVAIGYWAKATSNYGVAIGYTAITTGAYSVSLGGTASASRTAALGALGVASHDDAISLGSGKSNFEAHLTFTSGLDAGKAQLGMVVLRSDTSNATPKALAVANQSASTDNQIILPNNSAYSFSGTIIARESATDGSDYASWEIKGALLRDANAASTVLGNGIINKLYSTAGASTWSIALTADTTNGGLAITVTGAAATNIRWVATVYTSEVTYA